MDQSERSINWGDYTSPKASERSFLATIARFLVAGSHSCSCVLSGILQEIRCEFDHYALLSDAACRHTTYLGHLITWEEHMLALANEVIPVQLVIYLPPLLLKRHTMLYLV